ncbi:MAG: FmdB family zinc ribbon protein [Candidatus Limnocylindria bacterium]
MPIYDYLCAACGHRFEAIHGVHADGPSACPACHSDRVRKAFVAPAVHFKGSGWAKRDRRVTSTPGAATAATAGSAEPSGSSGGAGSQGSNGSDGASATTSGTDTAAVSSGTPAAAGAGSD